MFKAYAVTIPVFDVWVLYVEVVFVFSIFAASAVAVCAPNDTEVATIPNANAFDSVDFVFFSVNMMFDTHPLISKICIS